MPLSVLDLAPIVSGSTAGEALRRSIDLARFAEILGYHRYWVAEHHNMIAVASAAPAVLIGQLAASTDRIRIGSGGVMLTNHEPLVVAEQFGTLEAFHPGRIDLGVGRASGSSKRVAAVLRGPTRGSAADTFAARLNELIAYLEPPGSDDAIRAIPANGNSPPVWMLSSSEFGARPVRAGSSSCPGTTAAGYSCRPRRRRPPTRTPRRT